jgi:1-acyl-sn-glycerol-3-phosphate acyltransferase
MFPHRGKAAIWIFPEGRRAAARVGSAYRKAFWATDMDSARVKYRLPIISGRIAMMGSFVSRLVAFCLLYFAPVLASEQDAPDAGPASVVALPFGELLAAESLDPKHDKDHDQDRESDRGRGHFQPR